MTKPKVHKKSNAGAVKMKGLAFDAQFIPQVLDGTKTMTRRRMKVQPRGKAIFKNRYRTLHGDVMSGWIDEQPFEYVFNRALADPKYSVGEIVFLQEPWALNHIAFLNTDLLPQNKPKDLDPDCGIVYQAEDAFKDQLEQIEGGIPSWNRAKEMHEWASRARLEITRVFPQRIQEITEEDAIREGVRPALYIPLPESGFGVHRYRFRALWDSLYPGSWEKNEWCWVYEWRVVK